MESRAATATLGRSLLVPSVQEMAKKPITSVPARYIRHDQADPVVSDPAPPSQVPIIDMQRLLEDGDSVDSDELAKLHSACKDWGFFQLINHGVSSSLVDEVKRGVEDFFNLPMKEKEKFWQTSEEIEGFGQAFVMSDEQKLDWGDMFFITTLPVSMRKPHLFPKLPVPFRNTLESYSKELKNLAKTIIAQFSKALKLEAKEMIDLFENGMQSMRMNYYPPCPEPEKVIGLNPHSDGGGLTILLQVNEIEGLQIKKDGKWVPIVPLPNAFIINIGDLLEIITNGVYRSIEHRATVNTRAERISIATFYNPNYEGEFGPASSLIDQQTLPLFKRMTVQEYLNGLFSRELDGKAYIDVLRTEHTTS